MKTRRAFTLIELLVVIAIIAILAAILFPVFGKSAQKGRSTQSTNNLKQWGSALNSELADNDNRMPTDGQDSSGGTTNIDDDEAWFNMLPPYFHDKGLKDPTISAKPPRPGDKSVWINPGVPKNPYNDMIAAPKNYLFCYAMNTYLSSPSAPEGGSGTGTATVYKRMKMNMVEHTAACVFMAEKADTGSAFKPDEIKAFFGDGDPATDKEAFANFLFCDGHVEARKRSNFDPSLMKNTAEDPGPESDDWMSQNFTYKPFLGAKP